MEKILTMLDNHKDRLEAIKREADALDSKLDVMTEKLASLDKNLAIVVTELKRLPAIEARVQTAEDKATAAHTLAWKASTVIGLILAGATSTAHSLWATFFGG
jgi:phage shock protein A